MTKLRIRKLFISQGLRWVRVVVDPRRDPTSNSNTPGSPLELLQLHWFHVFGGTRPPHLSPHRMTTVWYQVHFSWPSDFVFPGSPTASLVFPWNTSRSPHPGSHCPRRKALPFLYDVWKAAPQPSLCQGKAWAAFLWHGLLIYAKQTMTSWLKIT